MGPSLTGRSESLGHPSNPAMDARHRKHLGRLEAHSDKDSAQLRVEMKSSMEVRARVGRIQQVMGWVLLEDLVHRQLV